MTNVPGPSGGVQSVSQYAAGIVTRAGERASERANERTKGFFQGNQVSAQACDYYSSRHVDHYSPRGNPRRHSEERRRTLRLG